MMPLKYLIPSLTIQILWQLNLSIGKENQKDMLDRNRMPLISILNFFKDSRIVNIQRVFSTRWLFCILIQRSLILLKSI